MKFSMPKVLTRKENELPDEGHHTHAEAQAAKAVVPIIIQRLKDAGVKDPHITLYPDGSGALILETTELKDGHEMEPTITHEQYTLAQELVHSARPIMCGSCIAAMMGPGKNDVHQHEIGLVSCCGFVTRAREEGLLDESE